MKTITGNNPNLLRYRVEALNWRGRWDLVTITSVGLAHFAANDCDDQFIRIVEAGGYWDENKRFRATRSIVWQNFTQEDYDDFVSEFVGY